MDFKILAIASVIISFIMIFIYATSKNSDKIYPYIKIILGFELTGDKEGLVGVYVQSDDGYKFKILGSDVEFIKDENSYYEKCVEVQKILIFKNRKISYKIHIPEL